MQNQLQKSLLLIISSHTLGLSQVFKVQKSKGVCCS
jgi:hypothetical protein